MADNEEGGSGDGSSDSGAGASDWFGTNAPSGTGGTSPYGTPVFNAASGTWSVPGMASPGQGYSWNPATNSYVNYAAGASGGPNQSAGPSTATTSGAPSYVDLSDPTQAAVWGAFQAKGITPSSADDFNYWVGKINSSGGWSGDNQSYWASRMAQSQGGVGDYGNGPEPGADASSQGTQAFSYPGFSGQLNLQSFQAPTGITEENDPGYQARLGLGLQAINNSAAAKGTLLTGQTLSDLNQYAQADASQEYGNVYNRALQTNQAQNSITAQNYLQNYQQYLNGYNQALGSYGTNFGVNETLFNNALGLENQQFGEQYSLANLGLQAANGAAGLGSSYGQSAAGLLTGAGNATAAGQVGAGNAYGSTVGNLANYFGQLPFLNSSYGGQSSTPYYGGAGGNYGPGY